MSDRVCFVPTRFEHLRSKTFTLGFIAYSDYDQVCVNTLKFIPDDDFEFLKIIKNMRDNDGVIDCMFDYMSEEQQGCEIDGICYDWDEVKHIVNA